MQQVLYVGGAMPLLLLGILHLAFTLIDSRYPKYIVPRSVDLIHRMRVEKLRLTKETTVWRAWIGFNISHSLSVIVPSGVYLYMALVYPDIFATDLVVRWGAAAIAWTFVVIAKIYWFSRPFFGALVSAILFSLAAMSV